MTPTRECDALSMVAGGGGDDRSTLELIGCPGNRHESAPELEGTNC
jgi:hypothetical protein